MKLSEWKRVRPLRILAENTPLAIFTLVTFSLGRASVYLFACCLECKVTLKGIAYGGVGLVASLVFLTLLYVLVVGLWEICRKKVR
jgi:hypothetical protein